MQRENFVQNFRKMSQSNDCYAVELHCHLDGCITPETVFNTAKRRDIQLPDDVNAASDLIPYVSCITKEKSLHDLLQKFGFFLPIIADDKQAIIDICVNYCKLQLRNKVYYSEVRYSPHLLSGSNLSTEQVLVTILDTLKQESMKHGIIINSILCCMRSWNADKRAQETIELAKKYKSKGVVGIDMCAGHECGAEYDGLWSKLFRKARFEYGLNITIHAGEDNGPEAVYDALDNLNAQRIGHGYASIEDKKLMKRLKDEQIHLECCPTSSIITSAVKNITLSSTKEEWRKHPICIFWENGLNFGINTDDPEVLNCSLQGECDLMMEKCGFTRQDIAEGFINSATASFLDAGKKEQLVQDVRRRLEQFYTGDCNTPILSRL